MLSFLELDVCEAEGKDNNMSTTKLNTVAAAWLHQELSIFHPKPFDNIS